MVMKNVITLWIQISLPFFKVFFYRTIGRQRLADGAAPRLWWTRGALEQ
jgi:hypothetical protein